MAPSGNGLSGNGLSGNGLSGIARADVRRSLCPFPGYSPRTLWVLPGYPMGAIRALKGTPGTHTHRDNHVRVRGGEVVVGEQRRQCGGTGPAGVGRWYIVQVLPGCTRTRTRTRTRTHAHAHAHTHTHTHTHTTVPTDAYTHHTHTYTHSHTPALRAAAAVSERSACRTCAASPAHGTITARLWCLLRATNIDVYICMHAGSTEREKGHFTFTYEDGLEDDAAGRRLGSAEEANPTKSEKSRQGLGRWDHFRDGTCVTASHERSRRGREPPVHPPTGPVFR